MQNVTITEISAGDVLSAPQGPGTNALVHNPFAFDQIQSGDVLSAPQGPGTNALVQNPFAFDTK